MVALNQTTDVHSSCTGDTSSSDCYVEFCVCRVVSSVDVEVDLDVDFVSSRLILLRKFHGVFLGWCYCKYLRAYGLCIKYYVIIPKLLKSEYLSRVVCLRRREYWSGFCSRNRGRHWRWSKIYL